MNGNRLILVAVSIAVILTGYTSCVTSKKSFPIEAVLEIIVGDWQNTEFNLSKRPARRVIDQDGNLTVYNKTYDEVAKKTGTITITKAWSEIEGWLWFKDEIHYDDSDTMFYELSKLDLQTMDWSIVWSEGDNRPSGIQLCFRRTFIASRSTRHALINPNLEYHSFIGC